MPDIFVTIKAIKSMWIKELLAHLMIRFSQDKANNAAITTCQGTSAI